MASKMNAKQESENLMNETLPFAKKMLSQYGEFHPYGGYLNDDGAVVEVGAEDPATEYPKARNLIDILRSTFQAKARAGKCKATAIIFDVKVHSLHSDEKSDAVQVSLDHVDGYSVEVFFPYEISNGNVVYGTVFAQKGKHEIFGNL